MKFEQVCCVSLLFAFFMKFISFKYNGSAKADRDLIKPSMIISNGSPWTALT